MIIIYTRLLNKIFGLDWFMVFNATFNNISVYIMAVKYLSLTFKYIVFNAYMLKK